MINAEKFKTELLKFWKTQDGIAIDNKTNRPIECTWETCDNCKLNDDEVECEKLLVDWMLSEYKEPVELSKFEYDFLNHLNEKWTYIYRVSDDRDNNFVVTNNKAQLVNGMWVNVPEHLPCKFSNRLLGCDFLSFIKADYTNSCMIKDILGNCEVTSNE